MQPSDSLELTVLAAATQTKGRPAPKNKKTPCRVPGCDRWKQTRGLCRQHFTELERLVAGGDTTWQQLEDEGRCGRSIRPQTFPAIYQGDVRPAPKTETPSCCWPDCESKVARCGCCTRHFNQVQQMLSQGRTLVELREAGLVKGMHRRGKPRVDLDTVRVADPPGQYVSQNGGRLGRHKPPILKLVDNYLALADKFQPGHPARLLASGELATHAMGVSAT
jgi:hypothetical protein